MSKNKYKKEVNPAKRIAISAVTVLIAVGAVGGIVYHFVKAGRDKPEVYVPKGPSVDSRPGLGTPTKIYNDAQINQNVKNAAKAKKEITSNVPTLTNSDFNGDISSFLSSSKAVKESCPVSGSKDFKKNPSTCTVANLKLARKAGVSAAELICQSCPVKALRDAGYTVGDLKNGGHSAKELKDAGYTLANLLAAGYSPAELLKAGFSAESLRAMGLSADQMAAAGCSYQDLLNSGIAPELAKKAMAASASASREALADARDSGVSAADLLKKGATMKQLKEAGFSARELMNAGATLKQLKELGFSAEELARAGYSIQSLKNAGFSDAELAKAVAIAKQCSLTALKSAHKKGAPIKDLLKVCNAEALRAAGYTLNELVRAGADPKKLHQAGYSAKDMLAAGYDVKSLLDAGYTAKSLKNSGISLTRLIAAGVTPAQLVKAGFDRDQLAAQGISARQLLRGGASPADLRKAGFTATELAAAGANAGALKAAGFTAAELRQAGFTASQMRQAGFSAKALRGAGYSARSLKVAGYTAGDLLRAGFKNSGVALNKPMSVVSKKVSKPKNISNLPQLGGNAKEANKENLELERIKAIQKYQQQQLDKSQKEALLNNTASKMSSQARSLMSDWSHVSSQSVVQVASDKNGGLLSKISGDKGSKAKATGGPTFKAGTVMYATLDTSVDSDEKTPIMATIVSGELKGSKLIGSFKRVDKKVLLSFNLLNIPSFKHTVSFQGVAIDPATARTAISGSVNNHYWLKYGTAFVSALMDGIGTAVGGGTSNCQVWNPGGSVDPWCQTVYNKLNVTQSALVGLGKVGQKFSGQLQKDFGNMPPTIKIPGGTAFGLLFTSDLTLPQPLPAKDALTNLNNLMGETHE
jgi:intracellular multiplication protein IcmE